MSSSVASSLPAVWCSARENTDRFGRYGEIVASARTIARETRAQQIASDLYDIPPRLLNV